MRSNRVNSVWVWLVLGRCDSRLGRDEQCRQLPVPRWPNRKRPQSPWRFTIFLCGLESQVGSRRLARTAFWERLHVQWGVGVVVLQRVTNALSAGNAAAWEILELQKAAMRQVVDLASRKQQELFRDRKIRWRPKALLSLWLPCFYATSKVSSADRSPTLQTVKHLLTAVAGRRGQRYWSLSLSKRSFVSKSL